MFSFRLHVRTAITNNDRFRSIDYTIIIIRPADRCRTMPPVVGAVVAVVRYSGNTSSILALLISVLVILYLDRRVRARHILYVSTTNDFHPRCVHTSCSSVRRVLVFFFFGRARAAEHAPDRPSDRRRVYY